MDRKLTRKEKIKAKSKGMAALSIFLVFLLVSPVVVSNFTEISDGIGRLSDAITQVVKVTAFVLDAILG